MKKRIVKRILSTALAASMILGNIGVPQGLGEVKAEQADITDKTKVTDEEIEELYRRVSYTPQAVHDPSIIKDQDGKWYVFGSHRGVAKTSDLQNWETVNIDGLFGDGSGKILDPESAFVNSLYKGTIQVAGTAALSGENQDSASISDDTEISGPVSEPEEEISSEPEEFSEEESISETETGEIFETETASETAAEEESSAGETVMEPEETSEGDVTVAAEVFFEESVVVVAESQTTESEGSVADDDAEVGAELPSTEVSTEETEEPSVESSAEEETEEAEKPSIEESSAEESSVEESSVEELPVEESVEEPSVDGSVIQPEETAVAIDDTVEADHVSDTEVPNEGDAGTVSFGSFNAHAWATASDGWMILDANGGTNMWAPDIIYNTSMKKYCMYLSLNGEYHNSVVILLTSDQIEGPYAYQGPVVYSGFTAQDNVPTNYKNTDMKYVFGDSFELQERYKKVTGVATDDNGKITDAKDGWGDYWPHAIDPAVFYDADGNLWMIYGSWSGGIYSLQLDENTGLRDYTVTYESDYDAKGQSVTSDPYFGKKIAGGYYNSGEGPYIEKIGDYYYLFMSYGFYAPNGGYSMRIFRSENPDGPYVDTNGVSAIYDKGIANFVASYAQDVTKIDTRGMRLMTYYKWDHMAKGEVAQGHNSAIEIDGRAYVIYHTKFNDNTAAHELRVHELFHNKDGWIVASPFAFANDEALDYDAAPANVAGDYEIIVGDYSLGYDKDSSGGDQGGTYTGPLAEIVTYTLTSDNKIAKDGQDVGTWSVENGKAYASLTINGKTYSGVFAEVTKDSAGIKTLCFTGVDQTTGITLWGAKKLGGKVTIVNNVVNPSYEVPTTVYGSFTLPSKGMDADLYWKSSNTSLVTDDGTIVGAMPENDTDVTFTMTMVSGDYYYTKDYTITIAGTGSLTDGRYLVGKAYTDNPLDLPSNAKPSMTNPFYKTNTNGLELSGGVSIEFDVKHNGNVEVLGALFAFNDSDGGKLYFTQGSYLGYNAKYNDVQSYYDANLKDYALVEDYIGEAIKKSGRLTAHVVINLNAVGFEVLVDGKTAYDQTILDTENGAGTVRDFTDVLNWLQSSASTLCMGYGSWWDAILAKATISNMEFYVNESNDEAVIDGVIEALKKQMPESAMSDITLPVTGGFGATISWTSSHPDIIAADGKVTTPLKETKVTLTATIEKGDASKTVEFVVVVKLPATSNVILEKELLELTSDDQIELIDNPFYGKNLDTLLVDYDITFSDGAAKNGWDGIFAFFNSATTGRVSFQTNPYICLNEMLPAGQDNLFLDINGPDKNIIAGGLEHGQEYHVKIIINKTECRIYLDGELKVNVDSSTMSGSADFAELLDYVGKCDKFSWGVGKAGSAFWNTELATVRNILIRSNEYEFDKQDEVVLETTPTVMDNPLYGQTLEEAVLDFTVNFAEGAAMNGWDGLLAFYQPATGAAGGRVSIQTAPYICYNNDSGRYMDINNPNNLTGAGMDIPVTKLSKGVDYHYYISITPYKVTMEIDGSPVELNEAASSADISYQEILDYISSCQKFSWGVVQGATCYWGMEKCTLKDATVMGYYKKDYTTITLHYPDGTTKAGEVRNQKVVKPEFEGEDTNGKYGIIWYADEAKTELYDFDAVVSGDLDLYGRYYYYCEESGKDESGAEVSTKTGIWVERVDDQEYTGSAIKPVVTVYDGTRKLKEKVDYKVSYSNNKNVSTAVKPAKITITPCGNYEKASKFSINFNIVQRQINEENVTLKYKPEMNVKYNKQKAVVGQTQKVTLKYGKVTVPAKEYTVTYKKDGQTVQKLTDAGTYQLVIKTKDTSSFHGELSYDIVVTDKILMSALKIKVAAQNHTGTALTPPVSVTYNKKNVETLAGGKQLSEIFDIEYENNVDAGTASVTLTAKPDSDYYGSRTVNFKINGTAIKKVSVKGFLSTITYTGEEVTQNVTLILNKGKATEKTLQAGTDYEITYVNNTNAGKATMTITGIGGFTGTVKKTFKIGKIDLKKAGTKTTVEFAGISQTPLKATQDKSGVKPEIRVMYEGKALEQDKDYKVTYSNNKAVGTGAKVTVKGIGNYSGELKNVLGFEITPKNISDESITVVATDLKYVANGRYKAKLTVYDNGVKLSTKEYSVGAVENISMLKDETGAATQCGTAEVTLTGKKNYSGTRKAAIQIRKTLVSSASVTVKGTYYYANGAEVSPAIENLTVTIGKGKNKVTLRAGEDFVIESYGNNTKKGKATVTIKGIGDYGGTKTVKYTIRPKWMKRSS